jgi:hypothetical protein
MISSSCFGDAKEKTFLNAAVFMGMDSTMTPSKSRMRVVRGLGCGALSLLMFLSHFQRLLDICFDGGKTVSKGYVGDTGHSSCVEHPGGCGKAVKLLKAKSPQL